MSKEYQLTKHNLNEVFNALQDELKQGSYLILETKNPSIGKWGMARLWRAWMKTTADHMADKGITMPHYQKVNGENVGVRPFDFNDAHELFTSRFMMGADGVRLSWSKSGSDTARAATKGERFHALRQHHEYCTGLNIILFNPKDSEYAQLEQEQNQ